MNTQFLRLVSTGVFFAVVAGPMGGCGGGTITFGSGDDNNNDKLKVTYTGNINSASPVTTRDIVVFVYDIDDNSDRCPCPPDPSNSTNGKAAVISAGETEFTIPDVVAGKVGIVFLLDNSGNNADGEIHPGDPIAILDDVNCVLTDVKSGLTVTLKDIDVSFSSAPVADCTDTSGPPPAVGRARADQITKTTTAVSN